MVPYFCYCDLQVTFEATSVSFGIYWCDASLVCSRPKETGDLLICVSTHVSTKQMTWTCESNGVSLLFLSGAFFPPSILGHIGLCTQISSPPSTPGVRFTFLSGPLGLARCARCGQWNAGRSDRSASSGTWRGTAGFCVLFWILYSFFHSETMLHWAEKSNRPGIKP